MKTKAERITALVASEHSPIRTKAALEAMTEAELAGLEAHVTKKVADADAATRAAATATAAPVVTPPVATPPVVTPPVTTPTVAAAPTEEDWMKTAPASVRTLVENARKQEAARKTALIGTLKACQKVYSEAELNEMSVDALAKLAALAGETEQTDFSLNGGSSATPNTSDVYRNPPDGYRMALDKKNKEATH